MGVSLLRRLHNFRTSSEEGTLFNTKGLVETLRQVIEQGCLAHNQGHPGGQGCLLQINDLIVAKSNYRDMLSGRVLLQPRDSRTNVLVSRSKVSQHQHRFGLFATFD